MKEKNISKILFILLVPVIVMVYLYQLLKKKNSFSTCCESETNTTDQLKNVEVDNFNETVVANGFNQRQLDILSMLENGSDGKVSVLLKKFPGVTDRTLRRDFNKLESLGLVKRSGSTKSASYSLVK